MPLVLPVSVSLKRHGHTLTDQEQHAAKLAALARSGKRRVQHKSDLTATD